MSLIDEIADAQRRLNKRRMQQAGAAATCLPRAVEQLEDAEQQLVDYPAGWWRYFGRRSLERRVKFMRSGVATLRYAAHLHGPQHRLLH